jgi:hypothetical protein
MQFLPGVGKRQLRETMSAYALFITYVPNVIHTNAGRIILHAELQNETARILRVSWKAQH